MEKPSYPIKRKKRRTRRCLDEIRNRLRRKCENSFENSVAVTKSCVLDSKKSENRLVTTDRLTLKSMFPNAVTSETITRPILEEMKQKHNTHFVEDCGVNKVTPPSDLKFVNNNLNSKSFDNIKSINECGDTSTSIHKENSQDRDLKYFSSSSLFSPAEFINKPISPNKPAHTDDTLTSSASSQSSCEVSLNNGERYLKELIDEIPSCFSHFTSSINKEETTARTILKLKKLYMESRENECEHAGSNSGHTSTPNKRLCLEDQLIVENPLDYIRLEHERQQINRSPTVSLSDNLSPFMEPTFSPASSNESPPDLSIKIVPCDTPDYNYYPHPLK